MEIAEHLDALRRQGELMADAADRAGLAFWARRQAHETAIHHADAERAAGATRPSTRRNSPPTASTS